MSTSGEDAPATYAQSGQVGVDLNGIQMTTAKSDLGGAVTAETVFHFEQAGNVVSARYRGGPIVDGYLIGHLDGYALQFRYVQADRAGREYRRDII